MGGYGRCLRLAGRALVLAWGLAGAVQAAPARTEAAANLPAQRDITQWLERMHEAARTQSYRGTFVVSSANGEMSSARIVHACEGAQQIERIDALTGVPRLIFRRNDQVTTFLPQSRVVQIETREGLLRFPGGLHAGGTGIAQFYTARQIGSERVAGLDADVVALQPQDALRFGYRVWSGKTSGLMLRLQTLAADGQVLEQAAFSELHWEVPVTLGQLVQQMAQTDGYTVRKPALQRTSAAAEGWRLKAPIPGFTAMGGLKRPTAAGGYSRASAEPTLQWNFSDGLATVSLFMEPFDAQHHVQEQALVMGATHTLTRRIGPAWWLTAMGEVPLSTLQLFAQSLERSKPAAK